MLLKYNLSVDTQPTRETNPRIPHSFQKKKQHRFKLSALHYKQTLMCSQTNTQRMDETLTLLSPDEPPLPQNANHSTSQQPFIVYQNTFS